MDTTEWSLTISSLPAEKRQTQLDLRSWVTPRASQDAVEGIYSLTSEIEPWSLGHTTRRAEENHKEPWSD
jgi:hypothetical protein